MTSNDSVVISPWNSKNVLLTEDDVHEIFKKGGFPNSRDFITINKLSYYQTAFIHPSYVKKHIFEKDVNNNISLAKKPHGVLDLFEENNN